MKFSDLRLIHWPPLDELDRRLNNSALAYLEMITRGNEPILALNELLEKELSEIRETSDPDDEATWHYEADYYNFQAPIVETYRNIYWRSLLVSQIALLESTLKFLCTLIDRNLSPPKPLKYPKKNILHTYHGQLTKLYSLSSENINNRWPEIQLAVKIRNLITHGNFKNFADITESIKKISSIKILGDDDKQLEFLDGEYSKGLITTIQIYCNELVDAIDKEYKRQCIEKGVSYF